MNILVVNPPNKPFTNLTILAEPIDVLQIATVISEKFKKVKVLDMDVNRLDNNINIFLTDKNVVIFVYDYQIPLHTSLAMNNIFEIVRNIDKETKIIIIGKTSTYFYQKFIDNGIDVVIRGLAEPIINEVIDSIYDSDRLKKIPNLIIKNNNEIIITNNKHIENNFDKLPIPDRSMVEIDKYMDTRTMVTSRGCIGRCKFCNTPYYFGNWSGKGVYDVISEIEMLVSKFNAKKILFLDDNATVDKKRMLKICKKIKEKNIKCLFGVLCSIECYDKYMIQEMYKVGFRWIHFGIESGSELVLSKMNKNMNIEYIKEVIFEVKKIGYRVRTSFILDYPGSKKEDIIKTKNLLLTIKPHEIRLHYLSYRVGTPVFYENKNVLNKSQYIHNNKPNVLNNEISEDIAKLIDELKDEGYDIIIDNIDWNTCNSKKIVSFVPIKYGRFWYE